MDCPNDRYVNDEAICQAVVAMLARVGRQDQSAGAAQGEILRQGAGLRRLRHLILSARLDARVVRLVEHPGQHVSLSRRKGRRRQQSIWEITAILRSRN